MVPSNYATPDMEEEGPSVACCFVPVTSHHPRDTSVPVRFRGGALRPAPTTNPARQRLSPPPSR